MPNTIMHFEIPADDVERARSFYQRIFGWKFEAFPSAPGQEYFMIMAKDGDNGINGGLMKRSMPGQPFTNYVTVKSIDQMIPLVEAAGGRVVLPKQEIGQEMGWIAGFLDPENNLIGLHQAGPNAPRPPAAAKKRRGATAKKPAKRVAKKARAPKKAARSGSKRKRR